MHLEPMLERVQVQQLNETLENGLQEQLQWLNELVQQEKVTKDRQYKGQLQQVMAGHERHRVTLQEKEADIYQQQLQYLKDQERYHKEKEDALQQDLLFHMQQLQLIEQTRDVANERLRFHQQDLQRLQQQ